MHNRPNTVTELAPGLIRILAPNPSPMTYWGTNSYLLGSGAARVLIDPGPDMPEHRAEILAALPVGAAISHILVTHSHLDHSAGAGALAAQTGAPVLAFGGSLAGRAAHMIALSGTLGGGEGVDERFQPDQTLAHRETLVTEAGALTAFHTPGHMGNHLCFLWRDVIFSGDLVMGWSSSLISPPDGDAAAFRDSCTMLREIGVTRFHPGHGAAVEAPHSRIDELLAHRAAREAQILAALARTPLDLMALTRAVYTDLPADHLPAAARNTLAHLIDLSRQNRVQTDPDLSENALFSIA